MYKRVPAKKLEPLIENLVFKILNDEEYAKAIVLEAQNIHMKKYSVKAQLQEVKKEISSYRAQSEAIAERIAKLPLNVPVEPLYNMLTTLKDRSEKAHKELISLKIKEGVGADIPTDFKGYSAFVKNLKKFWITLGPEHHEFKARIIKNLISRIEVDESGITVFYHVGRNQIKKESLADSFFSTYPLEISEKLKITSQNIGSRTCNNGARDWT